MRNKIIKYDEKWIFVFSEDKPSENSHPVSDYYLKLNDLSINLLINIKWIEWGFIFLKETSKNLNLLEKNDFDLNNIINKSIQNIELIEKKNHILTINNTLIKSEQDLNSFIENIEPWLSENNKIHLKLKINLDDYLIISNLLFPTLGIYT